VNNDDLSQRFIHIRAMVLGYLRVLVRDSHLAEDLFQDTYLTVMKRLATYDRGQDFDAWVRGIARNLARNALRKRAHIALMPSPELVEAIDACHDEATSEENDIVAGRLSFLRDCMAKLTDRQKKVMDLRYNANRSMKEIADETQSSSGSIQVAVSRVRQLLLDCITQKERAEHAN
jgi:RNA polymerase sigma-70 factor, ECF subfamily